MCLAQGHNAVALVRLKPAASRSRVKYSTTSVGEKPNRTKAHYDKSPLGQNPTGTKAHLFSFNRDRFELMDKRTDRPKMMNLPSAQI